MADGIPDYDEIKLRIEPGAAGAYRVLAFTSDGSTAHGGFERPWSSDDLDDFMLSVGRPRRAVRGGSRSAHMDEAKRLGGELFEAIIQGDVAEAYDGAWRVANNADRGLRVTLQLSSVPELMEIPWELLYESPSFLAQSIYTPVVRSLDLKRSRPPRKLTPPLRILGMISSPQGAVALDVESERDKLDQALGPLQAAGRVELIWLEKATLAELNRRISAPDEVHVLHYIGHGAYEDASESGILILEDERGRAHEVSGEELSSLLVDERSLRLAVLNSCEGARTSHVDPFSGVATSLVQCGIEAVVGMQFEITDEAAVAFSEHLYTALSQGFAVDAALAQSRRAIYAAGKGVEFATPVLFLRGADTHLFDVDVDALRTLPPPVPLEPPPANVEQPPPPESRPEPPVRRPVVASTWSWLTGDRRRLAGIAGMLLALVVAIVLLGSGDPKPDHGPERAFITEAGQILERSRDAFQKVNRVMTALSDAESPRPSGSAAGANARGTASNRASDETTSPEIAGGMSLDEAKQTLRQVRSNRLDRAAEARAMVAPTRQARRTRRTLAAAFDRSEENNKEIQQCLQHDPSGRIAVARRGCLKSTRPSSIAATDAKNLFRKEYNKLRRSLGLTESHPSF